MSNELYIPSESKRPYIVNNINNNINHSDIITDNTGTNCAKYGKLSDSDDLHRDYERNNANNHDINVNNTNIYRYKFEEPILIEIYNFAKIHELDERKEFKKAWNNWILENNTIISQETKRLVDLGYQGDVVDKMFKSARYYFRKKNPAKKEPVKRRNYIGLQKELLESMDKHIINNSKNESYKPSNGFDNFCKENLDLLKIEVNKLISYNITDVTEIKNKIKKTYKNRYFMIINK
jgi:hypothetical protein